jgi:hypothetical protein
MELEASHHKGKSSLMERSSYNGRKMANGEDNQCLFPQELSGMAYCNDA